MQSYCQHPPILPPSSENRLTGAIVLGKHRFISLRGSSKKKDLCSIYKKQIIYIFRELKTCILVYCFNPIETSNSNCLGEFPFSSTGLFQSNPAPSLMDGTVISTCARCFSLPFFLNKQVTAPMYQRKRS